MRFGIWKRALVAVTLLAFFLGTAGQALSGVMTAQPCAMMMTSLDDVMSAKDDCETKAAAPICVNVIGCISNADLPNTTMRDWVAFDWRAVQFWDLAPELTGQLPRPELDPPIPA